MILPLERTCRSKGWIVMILPLQRTIAPCVSAVFRVRQGHACPAADTTTHMVTLPGYVYANVQ